jgi:hypothetical protein
VRLLVHRWAALEIHWLQWHLTRPSTSRTSGKRAGDVSNRIGTLISSKVADMAREEGWIFVFAGNVIEGW